MHLSINSIWRFPKRIFKTVNSDHSYHCSGTFTYCVIFFQLITCIIKRKSYIYFYFVFRIMFWWILVKISSHFLFFHLWPTASLYLPSDMYQLHNSHILHLFILYTNGYRSERFSRIPEIYVLGHGFKNM